MTATEVAVNREAADSLVDQNEAEELFVVVHNHPNPEITTQEFYNEFVEENQLGSMTRKLFLPSARWMVEDVVQLTTGRRFVFRFVFHRDDLQYLSTNIPLARREQVYFYLDQRPNDAGFYQTYVGETKKKISERFKKYDSDRFPKNSDAEWCMVGALHSIGDTNDGLHHDERLFIESTLNEIVSFDDGVCSLSEFQATAHCVRSETIYRVHTYEDRRNELLEASIAFFFRLLSLSRIPSGTVNSVFSDSLSNMEVPGVGSGVVYGDWLEHCEVIFRDSPILALWDECDGYDVRILNFRHRAQAAIIVASGDFSSISNSTDRLETLLTKCSENNWSMTSSRYWDMVIPKHFGYAPTIIRSNQQEVALIQDFGSTLSSTHILNVLTSGSFDHQWFAIS